MTMKLTFLGTGGAFTDFRENYHNNAVVHTDSGYIMLDCGATAVQSLKELGIPVWDIAGVIITHMHCDHMGGLEQLIWERYYTGPEGPGWLKTDVFATPEVHAALRRALSDCLEEINTPYGTQPGGYDKLVNVCYLYNHGMTCGGVGFNLLPTHHVTGDGIDKPANGVLLTEMGAKRHTQAYFTSDTRFNPDLFKLYPDMPIFHDCSFGPKYDGTVHTHYEDLLALDAETRSRIILMHYTKVPEGFTPEESGFRVAQKHETFDIG